MFENYLSVIGDTITEKTIEKSRFITQSRHVEGEEEAKAFIAEVRAKYADATHNCYAYVADGEGNFLRFSDDNEPQGTAGMPILEVIRTLSLRQTAVVVTRYFGGIKLGAGGLVRAYSGCAADNLKEAEKAVFSQCFENVYAVGYPLADVARRFLEEADCTLIKAEYGEGVLYSVAVKESALSAFESAFKNRLNGDVKLVSSTPCVRPFPI